MEILVNVDHQKLKVPTNLRTYVSGTQKFVKFIFDLGEDWDGLTCFAQFIQDGVAYNQLLDEENSAYLPAEIGPGTCTMMLYGTGGEEGDVHATSNFITFTIDKNILVDDAITTEITKTLYDQIIERINNIEAANVADQIAQLATKESLQQEVTRATNAENALSGRIDEKANILDLQNEVTRAQNAEALKADITALARLRDKIDRVEGQVSDLSENERIEEMINTSVDSVINGLLNSGELANLTIGDHTVGNDKLTEAVNTSLGKADTAMQPSVYDTNGKETDIFDYADAAAGVVDAKVTTNANAITAIQTEIQGAYRSGTNSLADSINDAVETAQYYAANLVANLTSFRVEIVEELPQTGDPEILYLVPKSTSNHYDKWLWITEIVDEVETSRWENIGSSSTVVIEEFPQVGDPDTDYILHTDSGYMYYKYINNEWTLIAGGGGGGELLGENSQVTGGYNQYVIVTSVPDASDANADNYTNGVRYLNVTNMMEYNIIFSDDVYSWDNGTELVEEPSDKKDYYVQDNNQHWLHYRYIGDSFKQIGKNSYTKDEVDLKINGVRTEIGSYGQAIERNASSIESLGQTLGALKNTVDGLDTEGYQYTQSIDKNEETGEYTLSLIESHGGTETVVSTNRLPAGGGGGGGAALTTLTVEKITPSPLIITPTDSAIITINYSSVDEEQETYDATYTWKRGQNIIMTGDLVSQGLHSFDFTEFVTTGTEKYTLTVVDTAGSSVVKTWTIQMVDIRLESNYSDRYVNEIGKSVRFTYTPYGAVNKTVHFILDGVELNSVTTAASGIPSSFDIPAQSHGAHLFECFITAVVNNVNIETEHIYKDIIWYDEASNVPVIGCIYRNDYYHVVTNPINEKLDDYYILDNGYKKASYKVVENPTVDNISTYYEQIGRNYVITEDVEINLEKTYYVKEITQGITYYSHSVYVRQYDTTNIRYYVYDPTTNTPQVTLSADGTTTTQAIENNTDIWSYQTSVVGAHELSITCGATTVNITLNALTLGIDASPVEGGLEIDFNPTGVTNASDNRIWSNDNYHMTVSENFDWANGGYKIDENGDSYFLIKSGNSVTFDYMMFNGNPANNITVNGGEMKIVFMTENVQNPDAVWLSNVETTTVSTEEDGQTITSTINMGIQLGVHEGWLKTNNASDNDVNIGEGESADTVASTNTYLYMPYSEEDIIEMDINIDQLPEVSESTPNPESFVLSYEDGVPSKAYVYDSGHRFYQYTPKPIVIGSDYCDVRIYRLKIYSVSLDTESIMRNFIADARNASVMLQRYDRNSIYYNNEDGEYTPYSSRGSLDPERLAKVIPNVKVLMLETDHFTTSKKTFVKSSLRCIHQPGGDKFAGDSYYDNWLFENGYHAGQGTTSDNYGNSGRNVDFLFNCDGTHKPSDKVSAESDYISQVTLGYKTSNPYTETCDNWKGSNGKVSLTRTSVPNNFFNLKVNIASSENVNNALLQKRYNDFLPYISPVKARDSKVKNDMEFVPAVLFLKETNPDISAHNEFLDNEWHFYALGNIGDSKKTDYTRAYDPTDKNEFTIEISDNTKNNATFQTGVYEDANHELHYETFHLEKTWDDDDGLIVTPVPDVSVSRHVYPVPKAQADELLFQQGTIHVINNTGKPEYDGDETGYLNMRIWCLYNEGFDGDHSFEPRYACCGDYRDGKLVNDTGNGGKPQVKINEKVWREFYKWVITSTDEEFVNELDQWCVRSAMEFFYAFTHYYTMMDNRAKNTFWHYAKTGEFREVIHPVKDLLHVYTELINDEQIPTEDTEIDPNKTYYTQYAFDIWDYDNDRLMSL